MFKFLVSLSIATLLILGGSLVYLSNNGNSVEIFRDIDFPELGEIPNLLKPVERIIEEPKETDTITLEKGNILVFNDVVTWESVAKAQDRLIALDNKLPKGTPIYMVLNTPGGSVDDGMLLIDTAKALNREIKTVTLFAASMGFHMVQNLGTRYVMTSSTLMSHRARVGGMSGQLDGEFETRYHAIMRQIKYLDFIAATRMGLTMEAYTELIREEYWVNGFDAVKDKAADKQVTVRCGKSLTGSYWTTVKTFFGDVKVRFSECPLIKAPLDIVYPKFEDEKGKKKEALIRAILKLQYDNPEIFVKKYIVTDRYKKFYK